MKIAVEGCAHGELEKIYECITTLEERERCKIDLLICCGDFQSVRNNDDLQSMAVPEAYQNICSFYKYYSGEKIAPVLTIFIGGNHEASNYLQELPYGGWVAPNIYYMGRAGVINFAGLRIGGLSGIFKGTDYLQGLHECPPYNNKTMRSVYHVRAFDVFRLRQIKEKVDIMLSHDWPRGITKYGNVGQLLKRKPFFRDDIESNNLGSMPAEELLHLLKPNYWFSAHLHVMFTALVPHESQNGELKETKFLALDKCLPRRRHLQILHMPDYDGEKCLQYDAEWLAILKNTNHLLVVKNVNAHMPGPGGDERYDYTPTAEEKASMVKIMGDMKIDPNGFVRTAPAYELDSPRGVRMGAIQNPQTVKLCDLLGIDDPLQVLAAMHGYFMKQPMQEQGVTSTPIRTMKLSLPDPTTPIVDDSIVENESYVSSDVDSYFSVDTSTNSECPTPSSGKKIFKRRNQALYTVDVDGDYGATQSDSKSPKL